VFNAQVFNPGSYENETFTKMAVIQRTSININDSTITPFNYIPSRLDAKDGVWPGGWVSYDYYNLVQGPSYSFYQDPDMISGVSF
jgi:hypothetical protein